MPAPSRSGAASVDGLRGHHQLERHEQPQPLELLAETQRALGGAGRVVLHPVGADSR